MTDAGRAARDRLEDGHRPTGGAPGRRHRDRGGRASSSALLRPLAEAAMASGSVPPLNNMGLPWPPITDSNGNV